MNENLNTKKFIKILGGSIGNHLTNAAINLGFHVDVFDNDKKALERMKRNLSKSIWFGMIEQFIY